MHAAIPLGRLLVTSGLLTQQALEEVLALQKTDGRRLGELLAEKNHVRPHQLAQFLSHQLACPWVSLQRVEVAREAVEILPKEIALRHYMVPVHLRTSKAGTALYVAMDDPTDDVALAEAAARTELLVKPMVALTSEIRALLERLYGTSRRPEPVRHSRPPKPPPPKPSMPPPPLPAEASVLDEIDVEEAPPSRPGAAKVLLLDPSDALAAAVRGAATRLGAQTIQATLADVAKQTSSVSPFAIVVEEDAYDSGRADLDRLALEAGAQLVVASKGLEPRQIEGFLASSIERSQRVPYEKGAIIEGRYELLRDLGGRLPGSRWEVRHVRTARRSMLKVGVRAAQDRRDAEAVRREQLALSKLSHPGAVELRDAGNTELGDPFVVLESLEGRTLEGLVAARGALERGEACRMIGHVAEILVAAHDAGVVHRAVRPENVVVIRDAWGVERTKLAHWESATADGAADVAVDLAGLGACTALALAGVSGTLDPELTALVSRARGEGAAFGSVKSFLEALTALGAPRTEPTSLLGANPERRGTSMRPGPPAIRPTAKLEELRRHRRAAYRTPVRVEVSGLGAIDGRSEDVSESGLFVVTRGKLAQGAKVVVRFALPIDGKVVAEAGTVRWSRGPRSGESGEPHAVGIELAQPSEESLRQIARYVSFMAPA